jgi:hypothetical protein
MKKDPKHPENWPDRLGDVNYRQRGALKSQMHKVPGVPLGRPDKALRKFSWEKDGD